MRPGRRNECSLNRTARDQPRAVALPAAPRTPPRAKTAHAMALGPYVKAITWVYWSTWLRICKKTRVRAAGEMQSCAPGDQPVYPVLRQLTSKPPMVTQIDGLLTPAKCAYLVQAASDAGFEASKIEGRGDRPLGADVADCPPSRLLGRARRVRQRSCLPATSLEPLQATSYARGQRYKNHHDVSSDGGGRGHRRRLKTIFAHLQADGELPAGRCGSATCFDSLRGSDGKGLRVYPRAGSAVM